MQKLLAATLALCPLALHAQAIRPAQPAAQAGPVLQSRLDAPRAVPAVAASAAPAPAPFRISTGPSAPELITAVKANLHDAGVWLAIPRTVTVSMTVSETGVPTDVKVVGSVNPIIDQRIVEGVEESRFKPSMLDGSPVARELTLRVYLPANTGL